HASSVDYVRIRRVARALDRTALLCAPCSRHHCQCRVLRRLHHTGVLRDAAARYRTVSMNGDWRRHCFAVGLLAVTGALGCSASPIPAARIETSIARTFANLVHVQVSWLGLSPMAASELAVNASCRKPAGGDTRGSGEWTCTLAWKGPDQQAL